MSATSGFRACSAIALPIEVLDNGCQILEPLCHLDYTVYVWHLLSTAREAGGAFLWISVNSMRAPAALKDEILALVFVVSDPDLAIAT